MTKLVPLSEQVRIVWNITNACPYNCPHCATDANHHLEQNIDKFSILSSILAIDRPLSIDFSGGDPLFQQTDIEIIKNATISLGKPNISISTTGLSLSKLDDNLIDLLASSYSLTYDYPHNFPDPYRPHSTYNQTNYEQARHLKSLGIPFDIMLPVHPFDPNITHILAIDLIRLDPDKIGLLQLMPTGGNANNHAHLALSDAAQFVKLLRDNGYTKPIIANCVLRRYCSAMTGLKIGLDQFGDVYGCLWASNLNIPKHHNSFYIGNVLQTPFPEILDHLIQRASTLDRTHCFVRDCACTLSL